MTISSMRERDAGAALDARRRSRRVRLVDGVLQRVDVRGQLAGHRGRDLARCRGRASRRGPRRR